MDICFKNFQGEVTGHLVEAATQPNRHSLDARTALAGDLSGLIYWYLVARWSLAAGQDQLIAR
jgi:hypothetical protein